jgi:D-psicose/D-tagatose/L-ribulose 3-epimerase
METKPARPLLFSFFMFTADLQPDDAEYSKTIIRHMKELVAIGYDGFDLPVAPTALTDPAGEVESYKKLRGRLDDAGLQHIRLTTNVAATRTFDPSSSFAEQRALGLKYLKSRIDITKALRAEVLAGPVVMPYGVFPTTDFGQPIWSDALKDYAAARYHNAQPIIAELGEYAAGNEVKVAIEPVDHWETPGPNLVREVAAFVGKVPSPSVGVCVDSAHVVLGEDGPSVFTREMNGCLNVSRLHYVHISAPDRGALRDSWIPWSDFLRPILPHYGGLFLIEVFNAVPVFLNGLRITRRKFWIPGEDPRNAQRKSAYQVAKEGIDAVRSEFSKMEA